MAAPFDPDDYTHAPIITVSTGCALVEALVDACPKDAPAGVKKAKNHMKSVATTAAAALTARNKALGVFSEEDSRELDGFADRAWGGLRLALTAKAMLPSNKHPHAKRASELDAILFGSGGTEFLKADYPTQKTAMAALLQQIDDDKLGKDIDAVVGPEFLTEIREVQPRYAKMVSERLRRDKAMGQNLLQMTRDLQDSIKNYARKVIGTIEHDDPATTEWARLALLPIANARWTPERGGSEEAAAPENAPAPEKNEKKPS